MKKRGIKFLLVYVLFLMLFAGFVSADIGPHPTLGIEVKPEGSTTPIYDLIMCYGNPEYARIGEPLVPTDFNYQYVKELLESEEYSYCGYCHEYKNKCQSSFQVLSYVPKELKIAILHPISNYDNRTTPQLYESEYFNFKEGIRTYQYEYEATLNNGGTITLKDKTTQFSGDQIIYFILALILTVIIERLSTKIYFRKKERPEKMLRIIIWVNLISLPIFWFLIPFVLENATILLILGEIFVMLLEGWLIYLFTKKEMPIGKSMLLSLINNIASLVIGGAIFLFLVNILMM